MKLKYYFCLLLLSGCAGANVKPIIDTQGVNQDKYQSDLLECQNIARQETGATESGATGAAAGAVVGGLLGLVVGGNASGIAQAAGAGAVLAGAGGAYKGNQAQENIVKKCLSGRGYRVLN